GGLVPQLPWVHLMHGCRNPQVCETQDAWGQAPLPQRRSRDPQNPMLTPPSIGSTAPVTNFAAGEQRYTAAHPMSAGSPRWRIGVRLRIFSFRAGSSSKAFREMSVSIQPGAIAFTRTFCGDNSVASVRTMPIMPDFAAL